MSEPFQVTRQNAATVAEALSILRQNAARLKRMAKNYPIFTTIAGYRFVLDDKQTLDQLACRLEEAVWAWTAE